MTVADEIKTALADLGVAEKVAVLSGFFKSGPGQYGEGAIFIGVSVPDQRKIANEYSDQTSFEELHQLISSPVHEHRLTALLILVAKSEKAKDANTRQEIVHFYITHKKFINNWDLVDTSCYKILGRHAFETGNSDLLRTLANEEEMWSNRIAVVSTMYHVRRNDFQLLKELVLLNLQHPHDLMHKANGWLLREMGKKDEAELLTFIRSHYRKIPRTTLRYAIEKFDEDSRRNLLKGNL